MENKFKADLFLSEERAENLSLSYNKAWVVEVIVEVSND